MPTERTVDVQPPAASAARSAFPYAYIISGLHIRSEIELPSAVQGDDEHGPADVVIRSAEIAADPLPEGEPVQGSSRAFAFAAMGVARFRIEEGCRILFQVEPSSDPTDVALYLLGTCFAVLLQQRGRLVLHASAVVVHGHAVLFCGPSGSGKSTLAATLCRRGYPLLNDDVCSLAAGEDGRFIVHPDGRMLKLWSASIDFLDQTAEATTPVRAGFDKFYSAPAAAVRSPQPVQAIYRLATSPDAEAPALRRLSLAEGTSVVHDNAFRPELVFAMGQSAAYFVAAAALQRTAHIYELSRPLNFAAAERTLDLLEEHWGRPVPALTPCPPPARQQGES